MKYAILCREDEFSKRIENTLKKKLNTFLIKDYDYPDVVISIGGDGTMLRAIHKYINLIESVVFIGVHTGTLGFLTDYQVDEIDEMVKMLEDEIIEYESYNLLEVKVDENNCYYAVNEIRLENNHYTQIIDVHIDDNYLQTIRGNGICVSSSLGSSAYNKALGGSIVDHDLNIMQLVEIASINHNRYRSLNTPLILAKDKVVKLKAESGNNSIIGIDYEVIEHISNDFLTIKVSDKKVRKLKTTCGGFAKRLKRAFII